MTVGGWIVIGVATEADGLQPAYRPVSVDWRPPTTAVPATTPDPPAATEVQAQVTVNGGTTRTTNHVIDPFIEVFVPIESGDRIRTLDVAFGTASSSLGGITLVDMTQLGDLWFRGPVPAHVLPELHQPNEPEGDPFGSRSGATLARHGYTIDDMNQAALDRILVARKDCSGEPGWIPRGPSELRWSGKKGSPYGGRTRDIQISPISGTNWRVYAAAADGGVWRRLHTSSGPQAWTALGDYSRSAAPRNDANALSCGALAVQFGAAADGSEDVIVVGTGEPAGFSRHFGGVGFRISTDGGATWQTYSARTAANPVGLIGTRSRAVVIDPNVGSRFFAATSTGIWQITHNGTDWQPTRLLSSPLPAALTGAGVTLNSEVYDLVVYTSAGITQLMAVYNTSGGPVAVQFSMATSPPTPQVIPTTFTNRTSLAGTSDGTEIWAVDQASAIHRYHSGTNRFVAATSGPSAAELKATAYAQAIAVTTQGSTVVVVASGQAIYRGGEWITPAYQVTPASVSGAGVADLTGHTLVGERTHADSHRLRFDSSGRTWLACDGGVYHGAAGVFSGPTVFSSFNQGYSTVQLTFIDHDDDDESYVLSGTQDNGTFALDGSFGRILAGGDGGGVAVEPSSRRSLSEYTNAEMRYAGGGGQTFDYRESWYSSWPLEYGPHTNVGWTSGTHPLGAGKYPFYNELYRAKFDRDEYWFGPYWHALFGYRSFWWRSFDSSDHWNRVTLPGLAAGNEVVSMDVVDAHVYVLTKRGWLYEVDMSADPLSAVRVPNAFPTPPAGSSGRRNSYKSLVVVPGLQRNQDRLLGGLTNVDSDSSFDQIREFDRSTSTQHAYGLGHPIGVLTMAADLVNQASPELYVGTHSGVFIGIGQSGRRWAFREFWNGLPEAAVQDLKVHPSGRVRAALYGRGLWEIGTSAGRFFANVDVHQVYSKQWKSDFGLRNPGAAVSGLDPAKVGDPPGDLHVIRHRWEVTPPAFDAAHRRYFRLGQSHNDIETWHNKMEERGYTLHTAIAADKKKFTSRSRALAKRFQQHYGLDDDGWVGETTWERSLANPQVRPALTIDHRMLGLRSDLSDVDGSHLIDAGAGNTVAITVRSAAATNVGPLDVEATLLGAPKASAGLLPDNWWDMAQRVLSNTPDWVATTQWSFIGGSTRGRATGTAPLRPLHPVVLTWDTDLSELVPAPNSTTPGTEFVLVCITIGAASLDSYFPTGWNRADKRNLNKVLMVHPLVTAIPVIVASP